MRRQKTTRWESGVQWLFFYKCVSQGSYCPAWDFCRIRYSRGFSVHIWLFPAFDNNGKMHSSPTFSRERNENQQLKVRWRYCCVTDYWSQKNNFKRRNWKRERERCRTSWLNAIFRIVLHVPLQENSSKARLSQCGHNLFMDRAHWEEAIISMDC